MPNELFVNALWAALLIGLLLPIVGRQLILWRAVLLGLVIPQLAMVGIAFVSLSAGLHWAWAEAIGSEENKAIVGALLFGIPGLFLIATPWRHEKRMGEAWLAVVYIVAVSATNLMLSSEAVSATYLNDLFHGTLLFIDQNGLLLVGGSLSAVFALLFLLRRRFLLVVTAPDYALVAGISVGLWTTLSTLASGLAIGVTVATAGPLVAFGFLVLPVLTAARFTSSLQWNLWLSMAIGVVTAYGGFRASLLLDTPLGDTMVALGCIILLVAYSTERAWRKVQSITK